MRTRRVRHAMSKIEKLLIVDGIKEDSHLWKSWVQFKNAFVKEYKRQWTGVQGTPRKARRRFSFKADSKVMRKG